MKPSFLLLTACKNEAANLEACLQSVLRQTVPPAAWVVVDDGSTDGSPEIVRRLQAKAPFLRALQLEPRKHRCFGAQYRAIERGHQMVGDLPHQFLGVLDADIALERPDYFERLFDTFEREPRLGIAGGVVCERDEHQVFRERKSNVLWSVAGGVQMFRRECYEQVGGYTPLEHGGSDTLAELTARLHGWETCSLPDLRVLHYRPTSTADGWARGLVRLGMLDASFGSHPLFMALKCLKRTKYRPFVLSSVLLYWGYLSYHLSGGKLRIPSEVRRYLRKEQMLRLVGRSVGGIAPGLLPAQPASQVVRPVSTSLEVPRGSALPR